MAYDKERDRQERETRALTYKTHAPTLHDLLLKDRLTGKESEYADDLASKLFEERDAHRFVRDLIKAKEDLTPVFPFFRFYANGKRDVTKALNEIIPGEWVYSHYAISEAPRDAEGSGLKPIMVLVKDTKAGAKVELMLNRGLKGEGAVTIKSVELVPDTAETFRRALYRYGGEVSDYPWNTVEESRA